MFPVSDEYREQIKNHGRNEQYIYIKLFETFTNSDQTNNPYTSNPHDKVLLEIDTSKPTSDIQFQDSNWINEIEPLGSKLPQETFSFTFIDINRVYDSEKPYGKWKTLEQQKPVAWWYGYQLDSGEIEWIKGSTYLTTGQNSWDNNGTLPKATINAQSIIGYLENDVTAKSSGTYYDIIETALLSSNLFAIREERDDSGEIIRPRWFYWKLDEKLKEYISYFLLEQTLPLNQCLQLLAQAGSCILKTNRDGNIQIKEFTNRVGEYYRLSKSQLFSVPNASKYPILLGITTAYLTVALGDYRDIPGSSGTGQFHQFNHNDFYSYFGGMGGGGSFAYKRITFADKYGSFKITSAYRDTATGETLAPSGSYSIRQIDSRTVEIGALAVEYVSGNYDYYRNYYFKISGTPFLEQILTNSVVYETDIVGSVAALENPFLSSAEDANRLSEYAKGILNLRNMYKNADNRGFPEIDSGDIIYTQSNYNFHFPVIVLANNIQFNGTFRGDMKYLAKNIEDLIFGVQATDNTVLMADNGLILDWRGD